MSILRISDSQQFAVLGSRLNQLQVEIKTANDQITTGQRLSAPDQEPVSAIQIVRLDGDLAALAQYNSSTKFGSDILKAQDDDLGQANDILVRAQEIATELGTGTVSQAQRNQAAEEVHGLLSELTRIGNDQVSGRRIFAGLAPDTGTAPFDSPDITGYDPTAAYHGSASPFTISVGSSTTDTVRLTTPGDQVFTSSLVALSGLETALRTGGNVSGQVDTLETARQTVGAERASVGARENLLTGRTSQIASQTLQSKGTRSALADTDLTAAITRLSQLQTALQAALAAGAQIAQTSLASLLRL